MISVLCIILNFQCKNRNIGDRGVETPKDSISTNNQLVKKSLIIDSSVQNKKTKLITTTDSIIIPIINLRKAKTIEILSLTRRISKWADTTDEDFKPCKTWFLSKTQIKAIIREFEQVASEEINYGYNWWPCELTGKIKIDTVTYEYFLNPGSYLTLVKNGPEVDFVYRGKKGKKIFLSGKIDMAAEEEKQLRKEGKYPKQ